MMEPSTVVLRGSVGSPYQSYHALGSSGSRGVQNLVLLDLSLCQLPAHVQGGHGGVHHHKVLHTAQRF